MKRQRISAWRSVVISALVGGALALGCARHSQTSPSPTSATDPSGLSLPRLSQLLHPLFSQSAPDPATIFQEPFDRLDPVRWREVAIKGATRYQIEPLDGAGSLQASSQSGASILVTSLRVDPRTHPWLTWRWRIDRFVEGEDLRRKEGSDASARVYAYFDTPGLPWQKRNIDYVWSATLPVGTMLESPYSKHSKILVVESGRDHPATWRTVERNLLDDYRRCFGADPPTLVALGLMTDTDSTHTDALAYYDDLALGRAPSITAVESREPKARPQLAGALPDETR